MNKCLVFFVEGATELEFYKKLLAHVVPDERLRSRNKLKNLKGAYGFKKEANRKFVKEIKAKYGEKMEYTVVLCRDTDIFEYSPKPLVDWQEVENTLLKSGAHKVIHIEAKHCIEDWFLYDTPGVLKFLNLPKKTTVKGKDGCEKLKNLYNKAGRVYCKGVKSRGLIESLDFDAIIESTKDQLAPLFEELGVDINRKKR